MEKNFERFLKREQKIGVLNWEKEKEFYKDLKERVDNKIEGVFGNDDDKYIWLSLRVDDYSRKVKDNISDEERFQYLAYNVLHNSTVAENSGNIKYVDFVDEDYSVKSFYENLLKELNEGNLSDLKEEVKKYLEKHSLK